MKTKLKQLCYFIIFFLLCVSTTTAFAATKNKHPLANSRYTHGMVVAQEKIAAATGLKVLQDGGNAIDAAVTTGFSLAVTLPRAGNIGGGGFMLIYDAKTKKVHALDYRETAPHKATADMFLDENGLPNPELSLNSHLSIGVPGTVAGLAMALEKYGTISLAQALQPAIKLAENGFMVSTNLSRVLKEAEKDLKKHPATAAVFFKPDGSSYEAGEIIKQPDLAHSLKLIAEHGPEVFYKGELAKKIVADIQAHGGIVTKKDFASYKPVLRKPLKTKYRDHSVFTMPLPSAGGVTLIEMLNMLENYPVTDISHNTKLGVHLLAEVMKRAYADRNFLLGDPDFVSSPVKKLTSKKYAREIMSTYTKDKSTPSSEIFPENRKNSSTSFDTTHFSVMDKWGNAVSNTYTLNMKFGMKAVATGTGILLNNEMDDFTSKVGASNGFGLVQGEKNQIEPGKRMLSSMTPTIVLKDDAPYLVTGSPGGSHITTAVLQIMLNVIDHHMSLADATRANRVHHQWLPDEIMLEKKLPKFTTAQLKSMGHKIKVSGPHTCTQSILRDGKTLTGAADMRRPDSAALGY